MENTNDQLRIFLSMFAVNLPTLLVCGAACVMIVGRWRQGSGHLFWGILGFGLALVLCFVQPAVQTALQHWVVTGGARMGAGLIFSAYGIIISILHAAIYACLLAALFAGRPADERG
jgi:hypothetical protein